VGWSSSSCAHVGVVLGSARCLSAWLAVWSPCRFEVVEIGGSVSPSYGVDRFVADPVDTSLAVCDVVEQHMSAVEVEVDHALAWSVDAERTNEGPRLHSSMVGT
jgi:hypothetical protein